LKYLHSNQVVHGDLKGPSVLIDNAGTARIADFGLATVTGLEPAVPIQKCYSIRWTAPEVLRGETGVSKESDVYAFGMLVVEVFSGAAPFADCTPTSATTRVLSGERPQRPKDPGLTNQIWDMATRCLERNPRRRPDITEIVCGLQNALAVRQLDHVDLAGISNTGHLGDKQLLHRALIHVRRLLGHRKPKKTNPESWPASHEACDIKPSESGKIHHLVRLEGLGAPGAVQSRSSHSRCVLRRAAWWLLNRNASSTQDHRNRPDSSGEKQGSSREVDQLL